MQIYTFYPLQADGSSLTFESRQLPSDDNAIAHAETVRLQHTTCVEVAIWADERLVHSRGAPAQA